MLRDKRQFDAVEQIVRQQGKIRNFEKQAGPILYRMMITLEEISGNVPSEMNAAHKPGDTFTFICSFDFCDVEAGVLFDRKTLRPVSELWITKQVEGAELPSPDWIDLFIRLLVERVVLAKDGLTLPIYLFGNNESQLIIQHDPGKGKMS
ncbi:MAG: hypothetical protein GXY87_06410 [Tissierellia bacterium]|nr:hypothetical protein [Tissierellia bacterium]